MSASEEDLDNFKPIVAYLDSLPEVACGALRRTLPPYELLLVLNLQAAAHINHFGGENYRTGNYEKALRSYTREIKLLGILLSRPDLPPESSQQRELQGFLSSAYFNRGNTLDELGKYREAIADYDCALKLPNPQPEDVLRNRN